MRQYWLLVYATLLHACLFVYDLLHPEVFLHADRALTRHEVILSFQRMWQSQGSAAEFLAGHGIAGDYLPQALLYLLGGQYLVIAAQVVLFLVSLIALYRLVLLLTASYVTSLIAGILYLHLPHSLVFPHVLSAEAIFDPLVVISFYLVAKAVLTDEFSHGASLWGGLVLGLATLVRPITALWSPVMAFVMRGGGRQWSIIIVLLASSLVPVLVWMLFMHQATGVFSMGSSGHDAGHNLYNRVLLMVNQMPERERLRTEEMYLKEGEANGKTLSLKTYLNFSLEYPGVFLSHLGKDAVIFTAKSGIEKLLLDYFVVDHSAVQALQDQKTGFRRQVEQRGILNAVKNIFMEFPALTIGSAVGALLFLGILVLAVWGLWILRLDFRSEPSRAKKLLLISIACFPLYVFFVSQVVNAMQSRHRAPAEFSIVLLAAIGLSNTGYIRSFYNKST